MQNYSLTLVRYSNVISLHVLIVSYPNLIFVYFEYRMYDTVVGSTFENGGAIYLPFPLPLRFICVYASDRRLKCGA